MLGLKSIAAVLLFCAPDKDDPPRPTRPDLQLDLFCREPDIATPISLDVDAQGRVWVIESNTHFQDPGYQRHPTDRILIIEDGGGRGAHCFTVFADGLQQTMGLALAGPGRVHVATRRDVMLIEDTDGDGCSDRRTSLARLDTIEQYPHNGLSGFASDELGHLYFSIGENMGVEYGLAAADGSRLYGGPEGGSIFRMRADGSRLERWATGFWNTFHVAFDPFGRLFAVDNDPDSRPPCRLLHIVPGGDYGYRRWLGRKGLHPFTSWNGELPGTLPMVSGTGEAPSGIVAYEGTGLPADLRGTLIVTSWGDHRIESYRLEPHGASFRSRPVALVQGGEMFRPVGIAVAPDGSIFFSDWVDKNYHVHAKGRIWRLRGRGPSGAREGPVDPASPLGRHRKLAQRAKDGGRDGAGAIDGLGDPAAEVRAAAVRRLGERLGESGGPEAGVFLRLLKDPSAEVRREALHAVRAEKLADGDFEPVLAALEGMFEDSDPFLSSTAADSLARVGGSRRLLERVGSPSARVRLGRLLALRRTGDRTARASIEHALVDPDPEVRRAAIQWAGEERLAEHRAGIERALGSGSSSGRLFEAALAALSLLSGESPEGRDSLPRDDFLWRIAADAARPGELRARALRALSPVHPALDERAIRSFLASSHEPLRLEAVRLVRDGALGGDASILRAVAGRSDEPLALRREAAAALAGRLPEAREALRGLLASPEPLLRVEAARALRWGGESTDGASPAEPLLDGGVSEDQVRQLLSGGGDATTGEILFFHPQGPRCSLCHSAGGRGGVAGPDLAAAATMPRAKLIDSIVRPSREIAPQWVTWAVTTRDGTRVGTLLGEDADGALRLAGADGRVESIPLRSVRSRAAVETSLMPDDLVRKLTLSELRDILAFLESRS